MKVIVKTEKCNVCVLDAVFVGYSEEKHGIGVLTAAPGVGALVPMDKDAASILVDKLRELDILDLADWAAVPLDQTPVHAPASVPGQGGDDDLPPWD